MTARQATKEQMMRECGDINLQHFLNQLPVWVSKDRKIKQSEVLHPQLLLFKWALVVEKRRRALGLSDDQPDPRTFLTTEVVKDITDHWLIEFLETKHTQFALDRPPDKLHEKYWDGAPLPTQPYTWTNMNVKKKNMCAECSEGCLHNTSASSSQAKQRLESNAQYAMASGLWSMCSNTAFTRAVSFARSLRTQLKGMRAEKGKTSLVAEGTTYPLEKL